jgi:hypothetical protein
VSLTESNAIDLVLSRWSVPPSIAIIKRIDLRGQSVLKIPRLTLEIARLWSRHQMAKLSEVCHPEAKAINFGDWAINYRCH